MKDTKPRRKMELLAPAGTVESFRAAIDAGANAVYLGLTGFNARLRARNFTVKTLSYAVPFAHDRNVKVYVTFNTLVKQAELESAVHFLYQLEQIGVDAIIVQDLGIAIIIRKNFPRLRLHASTQMSVHNTSGLEACRRLDIRRAVAARELTIAEIGKLCAAGGVEIEAFAHGALCYSLSGMCLASSFFGGMSGNRGRCTQVCRRAFDKVPAAGEAAGYFFSPNDLWAIDLLPQLADAGVASLKIEGRMKGAQYVRTVVAAYRMALDNPQKTTAAKEMLRHDMGRRKTRLFLEGALQEGIIDAKNPAGTGIYIGKVEKSSPREITIISNEDLNVGDLLRVQPRSGGEGVMAAVRSCSIKGGVLTVSLDKEIACLPGDSVYLVGRGGENEKEETNLAARPAQYRERCPEARKIMQDSMAKITTDKNRDRRLFVKIDSYGWLPLVNKPEIGGIVCAFDKEDMRRLMHDGPARERLGRAAYIEPPPFVAEEDLGPWRRIIQTLCKDGPCGLMCQNLGHVLLEPGVKRLRADYLLWCVNRASQASYAALGLSHFTYSLEDDSMNIRNCFSQNGMIYLFTHVPLFISRIRPVLEAGGHVVDRLGRQTMTREKNGLHYLLAEETASLFNKRQWFEELGIQTFCIDLSFMKPDGKVLDEIVDCYKNEKKYPGSCLFNFKGGLK
ncbi:MAG TPA: peptidase U32 family protein [Chitinivibrionales bacterium]|nr:peptidase U32 family protein [Chitinivibrionales bacterium]